MAASAGVRGAETFLPNHRQMRNRLREALMESPAQVLPPPASAGRGYRVLRVSLGILIGFLSALLIATEMKK
jgi:hypothetical protein